MLSSDRTQGLLDEIAELWAVALRMSRELDGNLDLPARLGRGPREASGHDDVSRSALLSR